MLKYAESMNGETHRTMQKLDKADTSEFGTHVDLEESVRSASVADVDMLHNSNELVYDDFDFLTTMDVNKLAGQGWKKKKKKSLKTDTHSTFADTTLSSVLNLEDAMARFDLDSDGRLDEKEQALLYRTIQKEMEAELETLHAVRDHAGAEDLHRRMVGLRAEVVALQKSHEAQLQQAQRVRLTNASGAMQRRLKQGHEVHTAAVAARFAETVLDLKVRHTIERDNLDKALANERMPSVMHSKKYLDLQNTEARLAQGHQYKDAGYVKRMVDALHGPEVDKAEHEFLESQRRRRDGLAKTQAWETKLLGQRNLGLQWHDKRAQELQVSVNARRFRHHAADLEAASKAQQRSTPELYDPPSMLLTKRQGFASTAAQFRGDQLASMAQRGGVAFHNPRERFCTSTLKFLKPDGKPDFEAPPPAKPHGPHMPGLTDKHNFISPLLSTTTLEWQTASTMRRKQQSSDFN
mmetsp:Transcript_66884/g.134811  ORF Transcript_66884/g.134811 Transcript_66884/m.134811 type:complete len:465 (+) Transcript_66884:93-1487(+)